MASDGSNAAQYHGYTVSLAPSPGLGQDAFDLLPDGLLAGALHGGDLDDRNSSAFDARIRAKVGVSRRSAVRAAIPAAAAPPAAARPIVETSLVFYLPKLADASS